MEMQVERQNIGRIIGKGGSKIRELEEQSGCRIKVNGDNLTVELRGNPEAQAAAKSMIEELCQYQQY